MEDVKSNYGSTLVNDIKPPVSSIQSGQPAKVSKRERLWSVFISSVIVSIPALLGGCTLGFPSGTILDLDQYEDRPDFKFNSVLSDVFGVHYPCIAVL